ncbi:hypothetical protein CCP3SC1_1550002 [Gammaproteobacteria bacterium]
MGGTTTVSATATSGLPVKFRSTTLTICTTTGINGTQVNGLIAGICTVVANQKGNTSYNAAPQVTQNITVGGKASQTIGSITFNPATLAVGGVTTTSATATSGLPVKFRSMTPTICSADGPNGGQIKGLAVGSCVVAANQKGNTSYDAAPQVTQGITVTQVKTNQTIGTIRFSPPTLAVGGTTRVNATATSGLPVSFSSATSSVCAVLGRVVTSVTVGTCTVAADQAGNDTYNASPQVTKDITVNKADQTISAISLSRDTLTVGGAVTATATATSQLVVTFSSVTPSICIVGGASGNTVSAVAAGVCTVAADQPGNASYNAATRVTKGLTVTASTVSYSYPIVDTGQAKTYGANGEISEIAPGRPFYGQDAQFSGIQPSYTLSGDGKAVFDKVTKLTWMRGPNTTLTTPVKSDKKTLSEAQAWVTTVNTMNYGGFNDWRLPTIKELYSLINFKGTDPSGYTGTDLSVLTPFVNTKYFRFAYGQTSLGERIIDSQYASNTLFVTEAGVTNQKLFGVNLADGRIKGYDLTMPDRVTEKTFFVQLVRGPTAAVYGVNSFTDNGDGTATDAATNLMWSKVDSGSGMTWQNALAWVQTQNAANYLGHNDWRMPNVKELQSLVNYANAPDYNDLPAIDTTFFTCTSITNENGEVDYPYYWSSTTHVGYASNGALGGNAAYVAFGRALGYQSNLGKWIDIHGAGAQRSDPKIGPPYSFATSYNVIKGGVTYTGYGHGPQNDAIRGLNYVRLVRNIR